MHKRDKFSGIQQKHFCQDPLNAVFFPSILYPFDTLHEAREDFLHYLKVPLTVIDGGGHPQGPATIGPSRKQETERNDNIYVINNANKPGK